MRRYTSAIGKQTQQKGAYSLGSARNCCNKMQTLPSRHHKLSSPMTDSTSGGKEIEGVTIEVEVMS